MKKVLLPLFAILLLLACNNDSTEIATPSKPGLETRVKNKVDICHNGHIINVSRSAIPAHEAHGDAIDYDNDGYFSLPNNCGMPVDCDENDEDVTTCCLSGEWCGSVTLFDMYVVFQDDCTAVVMFNESNCQAAPVTWALVSVVNNVFTYHETDLCGINNCIVTVIPVGNTLSISYDCTNPPATGTLNPCN